MPPSLVAGAGGLLGKAVCARLGAAAHPARVRWGTPEADAHLRDSARRLVAQWPGVRSWQVLWCAGAGVHGSSQEQFDVEVETFAGFLRMLPRELPGQISLFLASSAGGIYSGGDPPFTERHRPNPISPYGRTKLATEELASEFAAGNGQPTVIGRIANLYGPGQNLSKPQGLISQLCWAQVRARPTSIYVSPDTTAAISTQRLRLDGRRLTRPRARAHRDRHHQNPHLSARGDGRRDPRRVPPCLRPAGQSGVGYLSPGQVPVQQSQPAIGDLAGAGRPGPHDPTGRHRRDLPGSVGCAPIRSALSALAVCGHHDGRPVIDAR